MSEEIEEEKCADCGCTRFEEGHDAHRYCADCGLVAETQVIDYGQDWRSYVRWVGASNS